MNPRWLYLALAVGALLGAVLTSRQDPPAAPVLVSGAVEVPFELNGSEAGVCDVEVVDGVVEVLACELGDE